MTKRSSNTALAFIANQRPTYMFPNIAEKIVTFDGGTLNGIGDISGTNNPYTLATVTGEILVSVLAVCTTTLSTILGATIGVGTAKSAENIIVTTFTSNLSVNEIWHDAAPDTNAEAYTLDTPTAKCFVINNNIILTGATADTTTGVIKFIFRWAPISENGNLIIT